MDVRALVCGGAFTALIIMGCSGARAQDSEEVKQLKAVADTGDYAAAHRLATMYAVGDGVKLDNGAADHWYSVAASRRDQKPAEQTVSEAPASAENQPVTRRNGFFFASRSTPVGMSPYRSNFGPAVNQNPFSLDAMPASQRPVPEASAWKKVQDFASEHSDDLTELATFLLEKYVPGLTPPEATTKRSGESTRPSK